MEDDSDILGGRLQISPDGSSSQWYLFLVSLALGVAILAWVGIPGYRQWSDKRYRKKLRRKYGIPDTDERPFNIAFAAVRQQNGRGRPQPAQDEAQASQSTPPHTPYPDSTPRRSYRGADHHNVPSDVRRSSSFTNLSQAPYYAPDSTSFQSIPDVPGRFGGQRPQNTVSASATLSETSHVNESITTTASRGKHAREEEAQTKPEKKSRLSRVDEEGQVIDDDAAADEEAAYDMEVDEGLIEFPKRGSKRSADVEDDESIDAVRTNGRDKRPRKVSRDKAPELPEDLLDEMLDEGMDTDRSQEMESTQRGKKRDRTEAGSTFGGDEPLNDEDEAGQEETSRRQRKRRTVSKKADVITRGQKRARDIESFEGGEEADRPKRRNTRKKHGKKGSEAGDSSFEAPFSVDPLCKGRRIGEEWEANGVHYKVGPNGQRLRQELVKKSRSRFLMPKDSQHPDRRANIDVYVETWLSEEEYQAAREQHALAWQDSPGDFIDPSTPGDVPDSPSRSGKSLLWSSITGQKESPTPQRGPFSQSMISNVGLRINPFQQSQLPPGRRVSSALHMTLPAPPESPKIRNSKSYSKWEKQDLEAAAMARIREKAQADAAKSVSIKEFAAATPPNQPSSAPTFSIPAPSFALGNSSTKPPRGEVEKPATSLSFGFPPSSGTANATPTLNVPKASGPSTAAANTSAALKAPSTLTFPSAPAPTSQSKPTTSNTFTFAPTAGSSQSQPATASTTSGPQQGSQPPNTQTAPATNLGSFSFGPKPTSATPVSSAPANNFGGAGGFSQTSGAAGANPIQSQPSFSFNAPSTTSGIFGSNQTETRKLDQGDKPASTAAPSNSLLSRLGPVPTNSQQPTGTTGSSGSAPTSSFGTPTSQAPSSAGAPAPAGTFGTPANSAAPAAVPASNTGASAAPRFNFGFASKPAATPSAPAVSSSADPSKPSFSFGASNPPASSSGSTASTRPSFSFGATAQPATSNTFGGAANPSTSSNVPTTPKSAFGAPSNTGSNLFSTTPAGTPATGSVFGTTSNNAATKPSNGFGSTSAPSNPTTTTTPMFGNGSAMASTSGGQPGLAKPSFSFGVPSTASGSSTTAPSTAGGETQSKPAYSFNFGTTQSSSTNTAAGSQPSTSSSVFGKPSQPTPNAFGFGNPSSNSLGSFTFGSSNTTQNQKQ